MTIIFDDGDFHIESHNVARTTIATNNNLDFDITLNKPGRFVGASACYDSSSNLIHGVNFKTQADAEILYGDAISTCRASIRNVSGGNQELGMHVIIFLRK